MSWDEINSQAPLSSAAIDAFNERDEKDARILHALFNSDLGKEALEVLRQHTECQAVAPRQAADGMGFAMCMAIREGENNLYRWIKRKIKQGAEPKGKAKR